MVDVGAMIDVENVHGARILLDPVDDPVGTAPRSVAAGQGPEQRLADPVWVDRKG